MAKQSTRKKPKTDLVVRLVNAHLRPWGVQMRTLSRALDAVQRLVEQREKEIEEEEMPSVRNAEEGQEEEVEATTSENPTLGLRLIGVKASSAAYSIAASDSVGVLSRLSKTGEYLSAPAKGEWTSATLSSIRELSDVARKLGCNIEFRLPGSGTKHGDVLATISPSTFSEVSALAYISGDTSVYGRIERVGGAHAMHCGIRIPSQSERLVICRVTTDELVRELGRFMYRYVSLIGTGTWMRFDGRLKHLTIRSYEPPKSGSILDALDRIYHAGGSAWDKIEDPHAYIAELRD